MECIIFCGLQAAGKSSFYQARFFKTHVRISMDLLRTRHRERVLMRVCLETQQRFVVDNTNPTSTERAVYISAAREHRFQVIGYYFESRLEDCRTRNALRDQPVPDVGLLATAKKLTQPGFAEGFDQLYYVRLTPRGFVIEEWNDEI